MFAWNHPEQNGTGNKVTQNKDTHRAILCYNIISLQNITLQIPIVTKSSILDFGKVSQIWLSFIYTLNNKANNYQWK